jgi:hypothetical protein
MTIAAASMSESLRHDIALFAIPAVFQPLLANDGITSRAIL